MPNIYAIDGAIADHKYRGSGHALAAIANGRVVDLVYIVDLIPDRSELDLSHIIHLNAALTDQRVGDRTLELAALGEVCVGMCSGYEFVVL